MDNAMPRYRRVLLIPLDGAPLAEGIIPLILDIAGPLDMDIALLRVVSPVLSQAGDAGVQIIIDEMTARMAERDRPRSYVCGPGCVVGHQ